MAKKMSKEIYFCVDNDSMYYTVNYLYASKENIKYCYGTESYTSTEKAIKEGYKYIVTFSIAHMCFDLLNLGYDIYLCYQNKRVKIEPHMDLSGIGEPEKDLRHGHNIFKMFRAGIFNELLGIKEGGKDED